MITRIADARAPFSGLAASGAQRLGVVALLALSVAGGAGLMIAGGGVEMARAAVILSALIAVSLIAFTAIARREPDGRQLVALLFVSFGAKIAAYAFRVAMRLFADAFVYHRAARGIAMQLAAGQWPVDVGYRGTEFVRLLAGLVYSVTGVTFDGIAILWTWFGLLGMLFFYRAFITAWPDGNWRLFRLLIFLYPSLLLWTSSLGKDALAFLSLGMAAYGAARIHQRTEPIGLGWVGLGILGLLTIRPHIAAAFVIALAAMSLAQPIRAGRLAPVLKLAVLVLFIVVSVLVVRVGASAVRLESLEAGSVLGFITQRQSFTEEGGGAFRPPDVRTPSGLVLLLPSVLFRPFLWEAHNTQALVTALEGMGLLLLLAVRWRSVRTAFRSLTRSSYVVLAGVYLVLVIALFSALANFGILARQRVQLLPFLFMLAAYPQDSGIRSAGATGGRAAR